MTTPSQLPSLPVRHPLDDFDLARVRLHQFLAAVTWTRANNPGEVR